jgi:hypothetical protein
MEGAVVAHKISEGNVLGEVVLAGGGASVLID